jgi:hypothetical protein
MEHSTSGLWPRSLGWSNAGCRCGGTQWMTSPSGLCMQNAPNGNQTKLVQHEDKNSR